MWDLFGKERLTSGVVEGGGVLGFEGCDSMLGLRA